jgi:hypothetical protein
MAPQMQAASFIETNGSLITPANGFTLPLPAISNADGYMMLIANSNGVAASSVVDSSGNPQLIWSLGETYFSDTFQPTMNSGTYSLQYCQSPLPFNTSPQSAGGGLATIYFNGVPDSVVVFVAGISGEASPTIMTLDRGVPNGNVFFTGNNTSGADLLNWSTCTYNTLQVCATISDTGNLGGAVPNGFVTQGAGAIWINNYLQLAVSTQQTSGASVPAAQLSWQQNTQMANMLFSYSDKQGGSTDPNATISQARYIAKSQPLVKVML